MLSTTILLPDAARSQDVEDLRKLIHDQAATIQALQERVSALESATNEAAPRGAAVAEQAALAPPASMVAEGKTLGAPTTIDWSEGGPGLHLPDGSSFHLRGRLYLDASTTSGSRFASRDISGTELNSARLGVDGSYGKHWLYKVELDFADGGVSLKENYLAFTTKIGTTDLKVYAGNKTGDRSIDGASYDGFLPFFQRTMLATSIGPEKGIFGVGVLAQLIGPNWHIGLDAVGDDASGNPGTASDTLSYIGRATWTPAVGGATRLHFGAWGFYEDLSRGSALITRSIYPGVHFNDNLRITMTPIAEAASSTGEGAEMGLLRGSFWAFGEYGRRRVASRQDSRTWTSEVAEAGYFLTGEKANFSSRTGSWTQVEPRRSVFDGGWGAIELVGRYETVDLGHSAVAGSGYDLTLAANWFLSRNVRAIVDWVRWRVVKPVAPFLGADEGSSLNLRLETSF